MPNSASKPALRALRLHHVWLQTRYPSIRERRPAGSEATVRVRGGGIYVSGRRVDLHLPVDVVRHVQVAKLVRQLPQIVRHAQVAKILY
ncbi:hypothetical protein ColKHC_09410 [Colletotrichum higginsianum]|nr:hypothetical protein ColKHC_09410 [Colletotrichum higginsianum]